MRTLGYVVLTLGLALLLGGSAMDLLVASVLGLGVGAVQLLATRLPLTYTVFAPMVCSFSVALVVLLLARSRLDVGVFAPVVAPIVTFLPGALLTTSAIELATGQMISGAGRLAAGGMQLVLLAIGIVAAAQLVGVPASEIDATGGHELGAVAPWIGVAVFGAGMLLHHCARPSSFGWILLVLYVAYAAQVIGGLFFGGVLSAFFGAMAMTPVAVFAATQRNGPPALVSFLPAFWLLVPGALGLLGVTAFIGDEHVEGITTLVTTASTMISIALGVLVGLAAAGMMSHLGKLPVRVIRSDVIDTDEALTWQGAHMTDLVSSDFGSSLRAMALQLDGRLTLPGDLTWDVDRLAWNLAIDQVPAAVVVAGSADDVSKVVRTAAELGLRVAPQSTGHHAAPMGALDGTVLLRMSELREVTIDPERRTARVEAGALWHDVTSAAATYGLAALAGSSHDVGVAGYTLGGGLSWLARSHGMTADHVLALEVVTADGQARHVSAEEEPDLFWALRGGGGSFAVVTALELELFPISEVCAGALFFPLDSAREVLGAWLRWTQNLPDEVMSCGRLLWFPPLPDLPPFLSGQKFTVIEIISTLSVDATEALLKPLRALSPAMDTVAVTPVAALDQLHMDPPQPVPAAGDGFLLGSCPDEALDAWLAVAGPGVETPLLGVELRQLGGAVTPGRAVNGGAVDGLEGEFACYAVGIAPSPGAAAAVNGAIGVLREALAPWTIERCYLNFAETTRPGEALFGKETYDRLRQVKATYDPGDVIRAHHQVPPA